MLLLSDQTVSTLISRYHSDVITINTLAAICLLLGTLTVAVQRLRFSKHIVAWLILITVIPSTLGAWALNDVRTPTHLLHRAQMQISHPSSNEAAPKEESMVGIVDFKEQYLLFSPFSLTHFGYHTPKNIENGTAWAWLSAHPSRFLLAPKDYDFQCVDSEKSISLGFAHRDEWLLIPSIAAHSNCTLSSDGPTFH
jgi:hypothetical protein